MTTVIGIFGKGSGKSVYHTCFGLHLVDGVPRIEISGPGAWKVFAEVLSQESGFELIEGPSLVDPSSNERGIVTEEECAAHKIINSVVYGKGGIFEAERIAPKIIAAGFYFELKEGCSNILNIENNNIRDLFLRDADQGLYRS